MKKIIFLPICLIAVIMIQGCSVFGDSGVEVAPYEMIKKQDAFEVRHYERLILVTTQAPDGMDDQKSPFYKLFNYISGENTKEQKISMTAPVFMDQIDNTMETMSFVLPADFTIETAPIPQDPSVQLEEITDYTVATVTFSGLLSQKNIAKHIGMLEQWIASEGFEMIGAAKAAGYNPPFTIPALRRNEILIPIKKP